MTEEKVDLPLQTESEKNYELVALFWQNTGELLHKSEINGWLWLVTGWLQVISGCLWVIPIFSNNDLGVTSEYPASVF